MKFDDLPIAEQEDVARLLLGPVLTRLSYGALFGTRNESSISSSKSRSKRQGRFPRVVGAAIKELLTAVDPSSIKEDTEGAVDFERILDAAVDFLRAGEVSLRDGISQAADAILSLSRQDERADDFHYRIISTLWRGIGDLIEMAQTIDVEDMDLISRKTNQVISGCRCLSVGEINRVRHALLGRMGTVWKSSLKGAEEARRALDIHARITGEAIPRKAQKAFIRAIDAGPARTRA